MKQKTGRKVKAIINKRFENCVVLKKANYQGNNLQYECICDCGQTFKTSGQQLRAGLINACPKCRKRKIRESREIEQLKRLEKINIKAIKYTLMNPKKTKIIRGGNGIHSYFCKIKARTAARVIGNAIVVPLEEALDAIK